MLTSFAKYNLNNTFAQIEKLIYIMKKVLLSLAVVTLFAVSLISCNTNSPKSSADKFLTGLYHMDYEAAKSVSTEETKKMLDMMAQFSSMVPDSAKETAKKIKVDIKDVKEEGDKAVVTYTTTEDPAEKKLNMVKQSGKWLVQWSKQDTMGSEGNNNTDMNQAPAGDSTADTSTGIDESAIPVRTDTAAAQ
jgi:hypothetical protein